MSAFLVPSGTGGDSDPGTPKPRTSLRGDDRETGRQVVAAPLDDDQGRRNGLEGNIPRRLIRGDSRCIETIRHQPSQPPDQRSSASGAGSGTCAGDPPTSGDEAIRLAIKLALDAGAMNVQRSSSRWPRPPSQPRQPAHRVPAPAPVPPLDTKRQQ